jgi:hypothetical protein
VQEVGTGKLPVLPEKMVFRLFSLEQGRVEGQIGGAM